MFKINENYLKLPGSYLFSTIAKKVREYSEANPQKKLIRLGIGDVTLPLAPAVIDALHGAVDEMARKETFKGYAPDLGYSSSAVPSQSMILRPAALVSQLMRFSSVTERRVIPVIFRKFLM